MLVNFQVFSQDAEEKYIRIQYRDFDASYDWCANNLGPTITSLRPVRLTDYFGRTLPVQFLEIEVFEENRWFKDGKFFYFSTIEDATMFRLACT